MIHDILRRLLLAEPRGGERVVQRVSYRSLDVEQFGYMYEGLLDHVVRRAGEPVLALQGSKHKQPEIPLRELESRRGDALITFLAEETGRSANALTTPWPPTPTGASDAIAAVPARTRPLFERVRPYANLLFDLETA